MDAAQIVAELPDLTIQNVTEALHYAAEAMRERELPLRHSACDFCWMRVMTDTTDASFIDAMQRLPTT